MKLSKKEVEHIALLARLGLAEAEKAKFTEQLSSILNYVEQLKKVNTSGIEPTAQVTGLENVMRADRIEGCDQETRNKLLKNVPEIENDLIKTKSVF